MDALSHPVNRLVRVPLGSVPKRVRTKVRLEDSFEHIAKCTLYDSIADRRNSNLAQFAVALWNLHFPCGSRPVGLFDELLADSVEKRFQSLSLYLLKRHAVDSRRPIVGFGLPIGLPEYVELAHMSVQTPKSVLLLCLRLDVNPPPQVLRTDDCFCHGNPAFHLVGEVH